MELERGALCISIDVEAGWGVWDKLTDEYAARCCELEETILRRLVELFDRHEISATWAIVGRLLQPSDDPARRQPERLWHMPELIDVLGAARVLQDVGSHSFEHIYFDGASPEQVTADLAAARQVHDQHGLPFASFVFPRNAVGHFDVLSRYGIRVARTTDVGLHMTARRRFGRTVGRMANLADKALPMPPVPVLPSLRPDGVVELPTSMLLMSRQGVRALVSPAAVRAKLRLGLEAAIRSRRIFHLWFHPSNFYWDLNQQFEILASLLRAASTARDRGRLDVRPMSSFAAGAGQ